MSEDKDARAEVPAALRDKCLDDISSRPGRRCITVYNETDLKDAYERGFSDASNEREK